MGSLSHGVPVIGPENYSRLSVPTIFKKSNLQLVANHQISKIWNYVHSIGKFKFKFKLTDGPIWVETVEAISVLENNIRCQDETFWNIAMKCRSILDNLSLSLLYSSFQMLLEMNNSQFLVYRQLFVGFQYLTNFNRKLRRGDYFRKWIAPTSLPEIWWSIVFRYSQQQQHLTR